jgi:hypothetical protein
MIDRLREIVSKRVGHNRENKTKVREEVNEETKQN